MNLLVGNESAAECVPTANRSDAGARHNMSSLRIIFIIIAITIQLSNIPTQANTHANTLECRIQCEECVKNYCFCYESENLRQWKRRRRPCKIKLSVVKRSAFDGDVNVKQLDDLREVARSNASVPLVARFKQRWPVAQWRRFWFTDDYLLLINPHWLGFPPPSKAVSYALGGFYIIMMAIGSTGNALVLLMYFRCRSLRTPGNILVANLALSDFIMLAKTPVFIFNSFNMGPALGKTGCIIYGFLGGLTGCTSIATLAAIALDRYWAIVRPLEPLRSLTAIRARLLAVSAWLYAAIFSSIPALDIGYGRYVPEGYLTSCSFDYLTDEMGPRYFIFTFFCAAWVVPFSTITYCYIHILRIVVCKRNGSMKNEHRLSSRHVKEQVKRKAEVKLAVLVIAVIALFFFSWTPYAIVALLGIFGRKDLITPTASMIPALFCKTAACINPFVYIITHPKFRKEFKNFLFRNKSKRMGGTIKTIGYTVTNAHRPSKDLTESDVEVVEMKDIPYETESVKSPVKSKKLRTVSAKVAEREDSQRSLSMKSFEEGVVPPPSWFVKPQFSKKKSFHRRSTKSVTSSNIDVII